MDCRRHRDFHLIRFRSVTRRAIWRSAEDLCVARSTRSAVCGSLANLRLIQHDSPMSARSVLATGSCPLDAFFTSCEGRLRIQRLWVDRSHGLATRFIPRVTCSAC
jgi:hypothetical protein